MGIVFANPWGLAALLALPALVAVHALRRRSRLVPASTLFLLDHAVPRPAGGTRLDRFRQGLPFWMQVLSILTATWLLVEPRWIRTDARQTVSVVVDGSASMTACLAETKQTLARALGRVARAAPRTQWHLLETGPRRPPLFSGDRLDGLLAALEEWRPTQGSHDFRPVLAVASSLAPAGSGIVVLVTDREVDVPPGVALFSVGRAIDNVGITGADCPPIDDDTSSGRRFRAIVTNHGRSAAERTLEVRAGTGDGLPEVVAGTPLRLALPPGASEVVEGSWPAGATRILLALEPDTFPLDDRAPLVLPVPRVLRVAVRADTPSAELLGRLVAAAGDVVAVADTAAADLVIEPAGTDGPLPSVQVMPPSDDPGEDATAIDPTPPAATDASLVRDVAWGGLLTGPSRIESAGMGDDVLLWKGGRPLVLVRTAIRPDGTIRRTLLLGFDPQATGAGRIPALVVLLARFVELVRDGVDPAVLEGGWSDNVVAEEVVPLPQRALSVGIVPTAAGVPPRGEPFERRAPRESAFFTVRDVDERPLFTGAALALDPREGDFSSAGPVDTLSAVRRQRALARSVADPWAPGWMGLVATALLLAWARGTAGRGAPGEGC